MSMRSPGYMKGWPPHQPLMSMIKYMAPSRRKEKHPVHVTKDRDLGTHNVKNSPLINFSKLDFENFCDQQKVLNGIRQASINCALIFPSAAGA